MPTRNNQADGRQFWLAPTSVCLQKNRVDMPFQVIHRNKRLLQRRSESLSIRDANQQGTNKSRSMRDADRINVRQLHFRLLESFADDRNYLAQVFARGQ